MAAGHTKERKEGEKSNKNQGRNKGRGRKNNNNNNKKEKRKGRCVRTRTSGWARSFHAGLPRGSAWRAPATRSRAPARRCRRRAGGGARRARVTVRSARAQGCRRLGLQARGRERLSAAGSVLPLALPLPGLWGRRGGARPPGPPMGEKRRRRQRSERAGA